MLSVFWVCSNQYDQFVRGQNPKERLTERSWQAIRHWVTKVVKVESVRDAELLDALLCFTAIHDLGKMNDFRADVVPHEIHDHDAALGYIMDHCPEVLPSYKSLSDHYKDLIRTSLRVNFNFGQFLQGENLPANLVGIKQLFKDKTNDAMPFFLFHIFADMAGILGARSLEGSLFMSETMYNNFARGIEAIQELQTSCPRDVYDRFLLKRAAESFPSMTNRADRAFARVVCLCRIFNPADTRLLQSAFYELPETKRDELVDYLNRDGIDEKPAYLLYYAPAFMENCKRNPVLGLGPGLKMLVRIYELVDEAFEVAPLSASSDEEKAPSRSADGVGDQVGATGASSEPQEAVNQPAGQLPGVVTAHLREAADWVKGLRDSSQFSENRLYIQRISPSEAAPTWVISALPMRILSLMSHLKAVCVSASVEAPDAVLEAPMSVATWSAEDSINESEIERYIESAVVAFEGGDSPSAVSILQRASTMGSLKAFTELALIVDPWQNHQLMPVAQYVDNTFREQRGISDECAATRKFVPSLYSCLFTREELRDTL
ncbi:hypothetical protein FOZ63_017844 [Perkinsus olseni]|uniref:Uncharacterized protein n=1 Tax=Perkinsus olseni TaxID=32597 RepID=A0A7J6QDC6_PEROL|nr:hypothetical protein FOZ63_017844 [Perkinsus olseni]